MPPTPPSKGNGVAIGIVVGVVGLVVAVPIVLIMAVTFLGTKAEPSFQSVGSADPSGNGRLIPIDPSSSAPTDPSTGRSRPRDVVPVGRRGRRRARARTRPPSRRPSRRPRST